MIKTLDELYQSALKLAPCRIAVAAAEDAAVLEAVESSAKTGVIIPTYIGDKDAILKAAQEKNLSIAEENMIHIPDKAQACEMAASLADQGKADLIMKGFVDTSLILRAVLNKAFHLRKKPLMSHVAVIDIPDYPRLLLLSDSAMNIAPTLQQKKTIIENSVEVAQALGNSCPKVAILCAVEKENPKMDCTMDAKALTEMNMSNEITGCQVYGPLALDNAIIPEAAQHKGIDHPVAGNADILIVPDIEAGNMLNKSMEHLAHAKKAGIIMGAAVPIVLVSRATSPESKMYSILLGAFIASRNGD